MAKSKSRPELGDYEAAMSNGFLPYGSALDYVLKFSPGMLKEAAHDRLIALWRTEQIRVASARSMTRPVDAGPWKQARDLDLDKDLVRRSWWYGADLKQALEQQAAKETNEPPKKKGGGRSRHAATDTLMLAAGAWLDKNGLPKPQSLLVDHLDKVAEARGFEISDTTLKEIVATAMRLWRADLAGN